MHTGWAKETPFPGQTVWLTNLLVRAFARDWCAILEGYPNELLVAASDAAADAGIPPKWLLDLANVGVQPSVEVAHAVVKVAIAMGPPPNVAWDTLVHWRAAILGHVYDEVRRVH